MKKTTIGLFGFGTVGQGLYDILTHHRQFSAQVNKICIKNPNKARSLPDHFFTTNKWELLEDPDITLIVELISEPEEALTIITEALKRGKDVVTANKKILADHMEALNALQKETGSGLLYEAAVCGSIPIIRTLEEYFDNEPLQSVRGIFNGSSNYILSQMHQEGLSYEEALALAQEKGFAEADPTLDVGGFDAQSKLAILIRHGFGPTVAPESIFRYGLQNLAPADLRVAQSRKALIKPLAAAYRHEDKLTALVIPALLGQDSELATVHNEYNAVLVEGQYSGRQLFRGKGAGGYPTGAAVLSDISANGYDYQYEYKKSKLEVPLSLCSDQELPIYLRYKTPGWPDRLGLKNVSQAGHPNGSHYIFGTVNLNALIAHRNELEEEGAFIALMGDSLEQFSTANAWENALATA